MNPSRDNYDTVILSGDVGGTNVNLSLVGRKDGKFSILYDEHHKSKEEKSFIEPLGRFVKEAEKRGFPKADVACVSAAGPVKGNACVLTNVEWDVDGADVERFLKVPSFVINDFTAVSYGVVLLDAENADEITKIPHTDGSLPEPDDGASVVLGAGTGLGFGYLNKVRDTRIAFASEGGHSLLPVYDADTRDFYFWLAEKYGEMPGAEAGVSGQGISNLFSFFASQKGAGDDPVVKSILEVGDHDRPAHVSKHAGTNPLCAKVMETFVKLYARVCANAAVTFLPTGGIYLAGGITAKNERLFLGNDRFATAFEAGYREHVRHILNSVPLYIVKDYSVSLYGCANAAITLR